MKAWGKEFLKTREHWEKPRRLGKGEQWHKFFGDGFPSLSVVYSVYPSFLYRFHANRLFFPNANPSFQIDRPGT